MPRAMSFALTKEQIRNRTKTVTRRLGWQSLKPGDLIIAVEKVRGLKKGDKLKKIGLLRCIKNDAVQLNGSSLTAEDVDREGFPGGDPIDFAEMFCRNMKCDRDVMVQRIEFEYVDEKESQRCLPET